MFPPALEAGLSPGTDTRTLGPQETRKGYGHQSAVRRKFPLLTLLLLRDSGQSSTGAALLAWELE